MRKLVALYLGFALAWFAVQSLLSQQTASFARRDGLMLALMGTVLFAFNVQPLHIFPPIAVYSWSSWGQALFGAGVATGVIGAALFLLHVPFTWLVMGVGVVVMLIGAWLRGPAIRYAPPAVRWGRDAQGRFVRKIDRDAPPDWYDGDRARWRTPVLISIMAVGVLARLLWLDGLPTVCIGRECIGALALVNNQNESAGLFGFIAQNAYAYSDDALWSIRLASALIGSATLPLFWLAARRIAQADAALLGLLLLSLLPWHLWASRHAAPWIEAPLWISLVLWAGVSAMQSNDRRYWVAAAVGLGLLLLALPTLSLAWRLWWLAFAALGIVAFRNASWKNSLLSLTAGIPFFLTSLAAPGPGIFSGLLDWSDVDFTLVLAGSGGEASVISLSAPAASTALVIVGVAGLSRYRAPGVFILSGAAACVLSLTFQAEPLVDASNDALVFLAPFMLSATVALDQLVGQTQRLWRAVVRPGALTIVAGTALLLALLPGATRLQQLQATNSSGPNGEDRITLAAAQYLATMWSGDSSPPLVLAPKTIVDDPMVQLSAARAMQAGLVRAFTLSQDLPLLGHRDRDVVYLFPARELALLRLTQTIYPHAQDIPVLGAGREPLLHALRIPQNALASAQGLKQTSVTGDGTVVNDIHHGPLHMAWSGSGPIDTAWRGSLFIPAAGAYRFAVETPPNAVFTLLLDRRLTLDTSAGVWEQTITLPQGWQSLDMRLRSAAPGEVVVQWQPPGSALTPIPGHVLFGPSLPNRGLLGSYFSNNVWSGTPLLQRKDWLVQPDDTFNRPYSVRWQGKLAAPRGGETLLGVVTDGVAQVEVDGRRVIDFRANPDVGEMTAEGMITLEQGWHDMEVRYAPGDTAPEFKLYWQPPGSSPAALPLEMLTPTTVELATSDLPLPTPPPLVDARLGDDLFALSAGIELWQPQIRVPPANLPVLPLAYTWSRGGCGSGVGEFIAPQGAALDPTLARVYVADTGNRRVVSLGLQNQSLQVLPIEGLMEPVDVALSPDGSLLILDTLLPGVVRFDPVTDAASTVALQDDLLRPLGLAVDSLGLIYIADPGGGHVSVFAPDGRRLAKFGGAASALGKGRPADILATGRSIWAIAAEHGRLWQMETLGSLTAIQPTDVTFGPQLAALPDGRFFLSDPAGRRIILLGAGGRPLGQFDAAGALAQPTGVAVAVDNDEVQIAIVDSVQCMTSLWRMSLGELLE